MDIESSYNFRRIDERLSTSGVVPAEALQALHAQGYECVLNLMPDSSSYAVPGERGIVEAQGIDYAYIPVDFAEPTEEDLARFSAALERAAGRKTHVHCAANYRVSAFYALDRLQRGLWSADEAMAFIHERWKPAESPGWPAFIERVLARAAAPEVPLAEPEAVLDFWFREIEPRQWWAKDPAFDAAVAQRFLPLLEQAGRGELRAWRATRRGRLAEVIVLDQFPRNVHRDTPAAFAHDPMALALAQEAVAAGALGALEPVERAFLLMPYMHSESARVHAEAARLFAAWTPADNHAFELRHKAIIDRFGRYPHRNAILGRASTPEEEAFLAQPGSRF